MHIIYVSNFKFLTKWIKKRITNLIEKVETELKTIKL